MLERGGSTTIRFDREMEEPKYSRILLLIFIISSIPPIPMIETHPNTSTISAGMGIESFGSHLAISLGDVNVITISCD